MSSNSASACYNRLVQELVAAGRGTQVSLSSYNHEELAEMWMDARNEGDIDPEWSNKTCVCGSDTWCGRDRHRPEWAVDEDGSEIDFFH